MQLLIKERQIGNLIKHKGQLQLKSNKWVNINNLKSINRFFYQMFTFILLVFTNISVKCQFNWNTIENLDRDGFCFIF